MISAQVVPYTLNFAFSAKTSRDTMVQKPVYYLVLTENGRRGIGECSYIEGLSRDKQAHIETYLTKVCETFNQGNIPNIEDYIDFPAIQFCIEMALLDLKAGGSRILFPSEFTNNNDSIPINGLVWMGNKEFQLQQIKEKIEKGFTCIKLKVGSLDLETELSFIAHIRSHYAEKDLTLRLDANGAYTKDNVSGILERFSKFDIHSIEQPLPVQHYQEMAALTKNSPIPIALDEDLIPHLDSWSKASMLDIIKPQYIILKPSLLGGFEKTSEWIDLAEKRNIQWWITSALESNIGLNAIAQWTYCKDNSIIHGLGTGQLYTNNIPSPLEIQKGRLHHTCKSWVLDTIN